MEEPYCAVELDGKRGVYQSAQTQVIQGGTTLPTVYSDAVCNHGLMWRHELQTLLNYLATTKESMSITNAPTVGSFTSKPKIKLF